MSGIAAFGLWLLSWGPNHQGLWAAVEATDALERRLVPWREVTEPVLPLWIVWLDAGERRAAAPSPFLPASHLPADAWRPDLAFALAGAARLLPSLAAPRLVLDPRHYRAADGGFVALEPLAPDSVERLLHALIGARLEALADSDPAFAAALGRRAAEVMAEVEAPWRRDAYAGALVDFTAHVLSISHEIGRHQRRRLARGGTLCPLLDHPATLFGSWRRALEEGEYRGYRPSSPTPSAGDGPAPRPGRWGMTRASLRRADKEWGLGLLGVDWSGDPSVDFAFLCP